MKYQFFHERKPSASKYIAFFNNQVFYASPMKDGVFTLKKIILSTGSQVTISSMPYSALFYLCLTVNRY